MAIKLEPIVRKSLIEDLDAERPRAAHWDEWIEAKAVQYSVPAVAVRKYLTNYQERMEAQITLASMPIAQRLAASLGVTRAKAISVLDKAMNATRIRSVQVEGGGEGSPRFQEVTEPDWRVRKDAAVDVLKIWGGFAPQVMEVRHGLIEELQGLSDEEIVTRFQRALAAAAPPEKIESGPVQ